MLLISRDALGPIAFPASRTSSQYDIALCSVGWPRFAFCVLIHLYQRHQREVVAMCMLLLGTTRTQSCSATLRSFAKSIERGLFKRSVVLVQLMICMPRRRGTCLQQLWCVCLHCVSSHCSLFVFLFLLLAFTQGFIDVRRHSHAHSHERTCIACHDRTP